MRWTSDLGPRTSASGKAGDSLRGQLDELFTVLGERLRAPGSGAAACRAISDVYDQAMASRFAQAVTGVRAPLALVATGGWARRELAPFSDIDFVLLHDADEASAKQVADRLLYPLWDDKLAVGHALREARAAARLAKDDLATATALLDARHIAGDRALTAALVRATLAQLAPAGNPNDFIAMLAAENKARHDRFGAAIYVLEPNLKMGIGALRDLSTALWAALVRWHPPKPDVDPPASETLIAELAALGHLTRRQADVLSGARDFQLRLRTLVQLTARRRFDQLTFETQQAIAPTLYAEAKVDEASGTRPAVAPAVEALMRDYYLHAREVVQVAERLLESARVPSRRKPRVVQVDGSFISCNGELAITDPQLFVDRPSEMVRLFRVAVAERLPVYGHTRELAAGTLAQDARPLVADRVASRLFVDALCDVRDASQPSALETMHQIGVLSALMPEWAPCTARVQHDLYHVYTVDQHQLYAVAMQKRIARGELADVHPLATELWRELRRPGPLLLATLLHDVGKPLGKGHAEKGAVIAERVARRFGMDDADAELAALLVRQHLTMSHLSQRRDLSDRDVIARFAEHVGDDETLVQLYLLTLCDTAMTAPDNLSAWKDELLRDLFLRTRAFLRGGAEPRADAPDDAARARMIELGADAAVLDRADPRWLAQLTPRQVVRYLQLAAGARAKQPPIALEVHGYPMKGHSEVAIVAPDAPGVLAAIAGVLTAHRIDVLEAALGHVEVDRVGRLVVDVFYARDRKGEAIADDDARWDKLLADLRALLGDGSPDPGRVTELIARKRPKSGMPARVTPGVVTDVRLHDDSTRATIVEVFTRDRVGVLHAITQTLADCGLDISLAKVSTEGEKVADVFYVTRGGARLTDDDARRELVARLRRALEAPGLSGA